jgi:hypothetical protein
MKLNDKVYDVLSWVGKICLPALAVLYATLADTWGLPYSSEISTTIMAIDVFLNALLGISSANFYKETYQNTDEQ